uniref:Uncharacterized protein n=1 Tax=Arundo donax TaxID=35708 RepID=A0A0A9A1Q0_ARUDO
MMPRGLDGDVAATWMTTGS